MAHGGPVVIGVDQGTTNTKAVAIDGGGRVLAEASRPIATTTPRSGWVDQDAQTMVANVIACVREVLAGAGRRAGEVAGLGIANQTETLVIWKRDTGVPVLPAMVWQCRRGEAELAGLDDPATRALLQRRTGLDLDPTFTAGKLKWVFENRPSIAAGVRSGDLLFGTVDSWLMWSLSDGRLYVTEPANASRTMLFDIETLAWEPELFELFGLKAGWLPEVKPSAGRFGHTAVHLFGTEIPITAALGDQQASLFGHGGFDEGDLKVTYGTGAFVWANAGRRPPKRRLDGLVRTIAWDLGSPCYALEGFVMSAGAALNWLASRLGLPGGGPEVVARAREAGGSLGVTLVPAFQGLASPWWRADARAVLSGMTEATTVAHLCHAGVEAVCYQVRVILEAMTEATGVRALVIRADGGVTRADYLMGVQADILQRPVALSAFDSLAPFGAALMAGLGAGLWGSLDELRPLIGQTRTVAPNRAVAKAWDDGYRNWLAAVEATLAAGRRHSYPLQGAA